MTGNDEAAASIVPPAEPPQFVTYRELRPLGVHYSRTQLDLLESQERFPKRIKLGPSRASRVVWLKAEIDRWKVGLVAARDAGVAA